MKVLVTGAGGMVGSHMVELLHDQGHEVLGTYYKPTTDITELDPDIRMEECALLSGSSACDFRISAGSNLSSCCAKLSDSFLDSSAGNNGNKRKWYD